jgi:AcrR family transcriptional regulator
MSLSAVGPTPDPDGGWDRRRRRISERIERIALTLFAERGYPNVTLVDVASAAGVSPRTLTRYFPLKEDLLLSQPRRSAAVALAALGDVPAGEHAMAALWDMWIGMTQLHQDDLDLVRLWYLALESAPPALARGGAEITGLIRDSLTHVAAQALEVSADDIQAQVLAGALAAALEAVLERWIRAEGDENLDDLFFQALEGLRRGFSPSALRLLRRR